MVFVEPGSDVFQRRRVGLPVSLSRRLESAREVGRWIQHDRFQPLPGQSIFQRRDERLVTLFAELDPGLIKIGYLPQALANPVREHKVEFAEPVFQGFEAAFDTINFPPLHRLFEVISILFGTFPMILPVLFDLFRGQVGEEIAEAVDALPDCTLPGGADVLPQSQELVRRNTVGRGEGGPFEELPVTTQFFLTVPGKNASSWISSWLLCAALRSNASLNSPATKPGALL